MYLSHSPDTSLAPPFCPAVPSLHVTAHAFGEVAGGTGGWGQCLAVSFLGLSLLVFCSAAPPWASPWATVPSKVYLPPLPLSVPACAYLSCSPAQASPCSSPAPASVFPSRAWTSLCCSPAQAPHLVPPFPPVTLLPWCISPLLWHHVHPSLNLSSFLQCLSFPWQLLPFLKYAFAEAPQAPLVGLILAQGGWILSVVELAGTSCDQPRVTAALLWQWWACGCAAPSQAWPAMPSAA